jgi:hypothetical protein
MISSFPDANTTPGAAVSTQRVDIVMNNEQVRAWRGRIVAICLALSMGFGSGAYAQTAGRDAPWAGGLFVGSNYQSVDRTREQVVRDIARMKGAAARQAHRRVRPAHQ